MRVSIILAALITAAALVVPVSSAHHHPRRSSPWADDHSALSREYEGGRQYDDGSHNSPSSVSASGPVTGSLPTPSPPPSPPRWVQQHPRQLEQRDLTYTFYPTSDINAITTIVPGTETSSSASASTSTSPATRATNYTLPHPPSPAPTQPPSPVPTVLDTAAYQLTGQCLKYVNGLVTSSDFTSCLPFSLLLSSSSSYKSKVLDATRSGNYSYLNELIAYSSSPLPSSEQCEQNFTRYFKQMSDKTNCASELSGSNAIAVAQAFQRGLGNYAAMRTAASLVNPKTGVYCYLEAVASERPDDLYLWQLPSGNILPSSSKPTCSACSGLFMNHIGAWNANTTSFNQTIIANAAAAINSKCGANFITYAAQPSTPSNDALHITSSSPGLCWIILATLISWGLVL